MDKNPSISIAPIVRPSDAQRECVNKLLRTHNQTSNQRYWDALDKAENAAIPVELFVFDPKGEIVGGLFGEIRFKWLKVSIMAIRDDLRRHGIGTQLLARAEQDAIDKGCKYSYVDTMEYQAPGFYEKAGYTLAGVLEDWDSHGHKKLFFTKRLRQA